MNDIDDNDIRELDEIETNKTRPVDSDPKTFYNQDDSIYVRLQFFRNEDVFRFEVKNELLATYDVDRVPHSVISISNYVRGMVEFAMAFPAQCRYLGERAVNNEIINNDTSLSVDEKDLLNHPVGNA